MIRKEEIIACEAKLLQAMKENNIAVLEQLIHDDLLFNGPMGEPVTKEMDLAAYRSGNMVVEKSTISDQQINIFTDTAIVTVTVTLEGQFMKQPIQGKFRYIRTWKQLDNKLQLIGGGCTPIV